jgi:transglutaminase-like putative cysteine protease
MIFAVTHLTDYRYSEAITDSVMELRMHPRSDEMQSCVRFHLDVSPSVKVLSHRDYLGNTLHTFDIPAPHKRLAIKAEAVVEIKYHVPLPDALPESAWDAIDAATADRDIYDMLLPGTYAHATPLLNHFAVEVDWRRRGDPLSLLRELNAAIFEKFDYVQHVTKVDSSIDVALEARRGVCQDFSHIMLALVRSVGIPCRYVSGYLAQRMENRDRSDVDASHAWVEAYLGNLGWVGFDPTNNLLVTDRHIRVSVANDYASASPSRGVFKGAAETELAVRVQVNQLEELPVEDATLAPEIEMPRYEVYQVQQQQQQQQ